MIALQKLFVMQALRLSHKGKNFDVTLEPSPAEVVPEGRASMTSAACHHVLEWPSKREPEILASRYFYFCIRAST